MRNIVFAIAKVTAITGGAALVAVIAITCISIVKRALGFNPILGDYELTEAGVAFAIMAFLPWCQLNRGHATVDLFVDRMPGRLKLALTALWELVFAGVIILLSWRLFVGMQDKMNYGETTFDLQYPIWWAYGACFVASLVACLVALWMVFERIKELIFPKMAVNSSGGPVH